MCALLAAVTCTLTAATACAARHAIAVAPHVHYFASLPIYPHSTKSGSVDATLAVFGTPDAFGTVADWYAAHMPSTARAARDNATSQATWAIFGPRETKTVHVEVVDGTVRFTLADVKSAAAPPTGR